MKRKVTDFGNLNSNAGYRLVNDIHTSQTHEAALQYVLALLNYLTPPVEGNLAWSREITRRIEMCFPELYLSSMRKLSMEYGRHVKDLVLEEIRHDRGTS